MDCSKYMHISFENDFLIYFECLTSRPQNVLSFLTIHTYLTRGVVLPLGGFLRA